MGLEKVVKIRIEPSIFEFLGWYDKGLPTFMNLEPLLQFGYNIDVNYRPLLPIERLQPDESYTDYYQRSFNVTKYFTNFHQNEGKKHVLLEEALNESLYESIYLTLQELIFLLLAMPEH